MSTSLLVHATTVAIDGWAVMLRGPSGAGKSDLGLRLIDAGARLVADDQCELCRIGEHIVVRAPPAIAGLIEIRGLGIVQLDAIGEAPLALIADLVAPEALERLPLPRTDSILGLVVPAISLAAFEASAAAKVRVALGASIGSGPAYITELPDALGTAKICSR